MATMNQAVQACSQWTTLASGICGRLLAEERAARRGINALVKRGPALGRHWVAIPTPGCWGGWKARCGFSPGLSPDTGKRNHKLRNKDHTHFSLTLDPDTLINYVSII